MLGRAMDSLKDLFTMRELDPGVPILDADETAQAIASQDLVVVLFYADWCGFSARLIGPFEEKHEDLPGTVVAANLSSNTDPRWDRYHVQAVPTVVAFRHGEPVARADAIPGRGLRPDHLEDLADRLSG